MKPADIIEIATHKEVPKFVFGSSELQDWTRKHVDSVTGRCRIDSGWYVVCHSGFQVLSKWSYGDCMPKSWDVPQSKDVLASVQTELPPEQESSHPSMRS